MNVIYDFDRNAKYFWSFAWTERKFQGPKFPGNLSDPLRGQTGEGVVIVDYDTIHCQLLALFSRYLLSNITVTLKYRSGVTQGYQNWHHLIYHI